MMRWILLSLVLVVVLLSLQLLVRADPNYTYGDDDDDDSSEDLCNSRQGKPSIRALHVYSDVKYRYATTLVTSRVVNPSNQSAEASFTLILPESAFISEFLMEVGGKVYKAYVKSKEEAKKIFNIAVNAGQSAGTVVANARDSNQFTVSVNIEAEGKVTFNLTYEQLLNRNLGFYSNVININPQQKVKDMSITVSVKEPSELTKFRVPDFQSMNSLTEENTEVHPTVKIEKKSPYHKVVTWAPKGSEQVFSHSTGLSGWFEVNYDVKREHESQLVVVDRCNFVHFFAPDNLPKLKSHVVFVLDYSGSMDGRKIHQLRDAMDNILSDLSPQDFFSIVLYHSYVEVWSPKVRYIYTSSNQNTQNLNKDLVVQATSSNIALARYYIGGYKDFYETNIMEGLLYGLKVVQVGSEQWTNEITPPQSVLVFLTDGRPNKGETNTDEIVKNTKELNSNKCPIFSLAFGEDADFNFLRKLSVSNFGFARKIYEAADASKQLEIFYKTIASPLISDVTFTYLAGQVKTVSSTTKVKFQVYFQGSELVVAGKLNGNEICNKQKQLISLGELSGTTATGNRNFVYNCLPLPNPKECTNESPLEKIRAYLSIKQLLDTADASSDETEITQAQDKALKLSLQFSFVTPLTSLVVVMPNKSESAVDTTKVQPAEISSSASTSTSSNGGVNPRIYGDTKIVSLYDIKWLQPFLANSTSSGNVTVTVNGTQLFLALNETDKSFGNCSVGGVSSECHHFKYCPLNVFHNQEADFIHYQCSIPSRFLGVCCPINLCSHKEEHTIST